MISERDFSRKAIRIEHDVLKEEVGCQDQIWADYGARTVSCVFAGMGFAEAYPGAIVVVFAEDA
jgi:hypothetical protein